MIKKVLWICFITAAGLSAQDLTGLGLQVSPEVEAYESEYFKTYKEGWILGPILAHRSFGFNLENTEEKKVVQFAPNTSMNLGGRFAYKGYGLGITFGLPGGTDEAKGESDYLDVQFMFLLGQHGFDIIFQQYQGFYINDEDLKDGDGDYRQYKDLISQMTSINYFYVFNKDYSLKAAFDQSARQLKDGGSIMMMVSLNSFFMHNSESIIPPEFTAEFADIPGLHQMWFSGIGVSMGFAYTFVKEYWFFTPTIFFGTNIENQSYSLSSGTYEQEIFFNPKVNIKISGGYNRDEYYWGAYMLSDRTGALANERIKIDTVSLNLSFFAGWRF